MMLYSWTRLRLSFLATLLASLGRCATIAVGPTAYISIASAPPFATMKPCAASCLVYKGVWSCGVNAGYHDLGTELSCGCSPQNFCYCDARAAVSASSYISSCVKAGCTASPDEVTSAMNLYNGYCATANVAVAVQTTSPDVAIQTTPPDPPASGSSGVPSATSKGTSSRMSSNSAGNNVQSTSSQRTSETPVPEPTSATTKKEGLTQSDVIALAVGLGVGVPSLLLALGTFCMQRRRKEKVAKEPPNVQNGGQY